MTDLRYTPLGCGWLTGDAGLFLRGETGRLRVPVPAYLIEHPKGSVLFDTAMHPSLATDPESRIGFLAKVFEVELGPDEHAAARLEARQVDPARIDMVILSHLHFDHAGGLETLPNAKLLVQRKEWETAQDPDLAAQNAFAAIDFDHGHQVQQVDGEFDVFGDGSVVCLPTHGHTPGHQSLRVRTADDDFLLTGDACYMRHTLEHRHLPSVVHDEAQMLASLDRIAAWEQQGAKIIFGHEPDQAP